MIPATATIRRVRLFVMSPRCCLAPDKSMQDEGNASYITCSLYQQTQGSPGEWMISMCLILPLTCNSHSAFPFHVSWVRANLDYDYALTRIWRSDCQCFAKLIRLLSILVV